MASSSSINNSSPANTTSLPQTNTSFVFAAPIKLTNTNYLLWKTQVLPSIRANNLEGFIEANGGPPRRMLVSVDQEQNVVTTENPEYLVWARQDQMLMSWLLSSMTEGVLSSVMECKSSLDLWTTLQKHFSAQTIARTMQLRGDIHNTKKEGMSMNDYYFKMKSLVEDLRCAGNMVSDDELVLYLMEGLGPEYDSVIVNITSRPEKLPLREVYSMLLSQERRIEKNLSAGNINLAPNMSTNYTYSGYNNNQRRNWAERNNQNQHAGNQNHFGEFLPGKGNHRNASEGEGKTICQICFRIGHEASKCWFRFNKKFTTKPGARNFQKKAYAATLETVTDPNWYLDSGATNHITNNLSNLSIGTEYKGNDQLAVGNGNKLLISHIGHSLLPTFHPQMTKHLHLNHILHVPGITKNLISISKLISDNNINILFDKHLCLIKDKPQGRTLLQGVARGGLYQLQFCPPSHISSFCSIVYPLSEETIHNSPESMLSYSSNTSKSVSKTISVNDDWDVWHRRLGHPHFLSLKKSLSGCTSLKLNENSKFSFCNACQFGKLHRLTFKGSETKTTEPLQVIHADLWGPAPILSNQGFRYYIAFVDDKTRFTWIYPLTSKAEALNAFKVFKKQVETMHEKRIKTFQCDMGGEFKAFEPYLKQEGITMRYSCPYTHHQNGKVERKHRHLVETGLTLLAQASMPLKFWWEAFSTATFLINRLATPTLGDKSPFHALFHTKPDYTMIKVFGCECYPFLRPYNRHKFDFHTSKCVLLGLSVLHKGYLCLHHSGRIYIARHVTFNEGSFPFENDFRFKDSHKLMMSEPTTSLNHFHSVFIQSETHNQGNNTIDRDALVNTPPTAEDQTQVCQQDTSITHNSETTSTPSHIPETQEPQPTQNLLPTHPMITRAKAGIFKPKVYVSVTSEPIEANVPPDVIAALSDPRWTKAMEEEINALARNETWTLVPYSPDMRLVGSKWVYKVKQNPDGSVSRFKARLVAKGFHQTPGLDYNETYSPVVKASTIRIVFSLAVINKWQLRQVDVNNAFLNGDLAETVYMTQPDGFVDKTRPEHVCKLGKALYGLKQAPRAWFEKLKNALKSWGFNNSRCDTSLFFRRINMDLVVILIYVDDIIVTGNNTNQIEETVQKLHSNFALKDLGQLHFFLGIEVCRTPTKLVLSQCKYISELLKRVNMTQCKGIETPLIVGGRLSKLEGESFRDGLLYRSVVGALQYATLTRPELAFAVNKLSQFMSNPLIPHWIACKRVLRYLKHTVNYGLEFNTSDNHELIGFCDADWGSDIDDRKSNQSIGHWHTYAQKLHG
ncbi:Retrovirus-related Pol polyprotein from transposon TNT 1-94 [Melia azedarach]|uniref:Retrovirus-related Pol polyprotein from transposon TNT 1-94 n=1 Tax=Melia azedarach TaxID=155640 RepID=A0ACC1Y9P6_MELAZ|nr:Retrovirus-related Pol polyprotein from transposon TNT 1-94 [Melia azedarach]